MRIISKGNKSKTRICKECGCEFEFGKNDIKYTLIPSLYNTRHEEYVKCPQCNNRIVIGRR